MGPSLDYPIPRELDGLRQNPPYRGPLETHPVTDRPKPYEGGTQMHASEHVFSALDDPAASGRRLRRKRGNVGLLRLSTTWWRGLRRPAKGDQDATRLDVVDIDQSRDRSMAESGPPSDRHTPANHTPRSNSARRLEPRSTMVHASRSTTSPMQGPERSAAQRLDSAPEHADERYQRSLSPRIAIESDSWTCHIRDGVPFWEADKQRHGGHETSQERLECEICQVADLLLTDEPGESYESDQAEETAAPGNHLEKHEDGMLSRLRGRRSLRALTNIFNEGSAGDQGFRRMGESPHPSGPTVNKANIGRPRKRV